VTTTALLIPVLNEAEALPTILPQIDPRWVDEILFGLYAHLMG
jgi:hypothetical protein